MSSPAPPYPRVDPRDAHRAGPPSSTASSTAGARTACGSRCGPRGPPTPGETPSHPRRSRPHGEDPALFLRALRAPRPRRASGDRRQRLVLSFRYGRCPGKFSLNSTPWPPVLGRHAAARRGERLPVAGVIGEARPAPDPLDRVPRLARLRRAGDVGLRATVVRDPLESEAPRPARRRPRCWPSPASAFAPPAVPPQSPGHRGRAVGPGSRARPRSPTTARAPPSPRVRPDLLHWTGCGPSQMRRLTRADFHFHDRIPLRLRPPRKAGSLGRRARCWATRPRPHARSSTPTRSAPSRRRVRTRPSARPLRKANLEPFTL